MSATRAAKAGGSDTPGLINALRVLRERWLVVVVAILVCVGVSLVLTLKATKQYTGTAKLLFTPNALITEVGGTAPSPSADPQADQATNLLLVATGEVAAEAKQALHSPLSASDLLDKVSTASDSTSNIVDVNATDPSPAQAAAIANAFAEGYVTLSQRANLQQVLAGQQVIAQRLAALPSTPATAAQRATLEAAAQKLVVLQAVQTANAQLVDRATPPSVPTSPNKKVNLIVALVFGLALGVGLAFLLNLLDRRLKDVDEFEEIYGTRAVATIPKVRRRKSAVSDPATIEQFQILRNGLSVLTARHEARVVLVTSAVRGEGKTTVAIGMARAAASAGQQVILVEADFKRPSFRTQLPLGDDPRGLSSALLGRVDPGSVLTAPVPALPGLLVMPSGPEPRSSVALLGSDEMTRLLEQWSADADLVVIDAPPLLPVADTQVLLDHARVDAYVIVGREGFTKRDDARSTAQLLEPRKLRGVGLVVNGVRRLAGGTYYYTATGSSAGATNGRPADKARAR